MKKLIITLAAIAICFGLTSNTFAQYVTAEFLNFGANGTLNRIRMDMSTPYSHGVDGVEAQFFSGGSRDLVIRLNTSKSKRTTTYDFSEFADPNQTNAPVWARNTPIQSFKPGINVLGAYYAKEGCQPVKDVNNKDIYNCDYKTRMNNGYLYASGDSARYSLLYNPTPEYYRPVNEPENTSFVNVNYYKGADGNEVFTITALPNEGTSASGVTASKRTIAGLEKTTTSKGKEVKSNAGQYVMPFTLVVRPK